LVLRTPCFGSSYPQVVRVPPVKNHCFMHMQILPFAQSYFSVDRRSPKSGPRAGYGPRRVSIRPASFPRNL